MPAILATQKARDQEDQGSKQPGETVLQTLS
jgi:hypothetical protein